MSYRVWLDGDDYGCQGPPHLESEHDELSEALNAAARYRAESWGRGWNRSALIFHVTDCWGRCVGSAPSD